MDRESDESHALDAVDRGILFALQRDARNVTHEEIGKEVGVAPSTVRNRIARLEGAGVIEGYAPRLDYERAGFSLRIQFTCTAPSSDRAALAEGTLDVDGVINVREMLTSERNLFVEAIAVDTTDLAGIAEALSDRGLTVHESEIIASSHSQPFNYFGYDESQRDEG